MDGITQIGFSGAWISMIDIWSIPNDTGLADTRDILVENGMFKNLGEKVLCAVVNDKGQRDRVLKRLQKETPNGEFIAETGGGDYSYIYQIWYELIPGSDKECLQYDQDEIQEHNRNLLAAIEAEQMQTLREAFPEEFSPERFAEYQMGVIVNA
jgi:hypothetical protein